VAWPDQHLKAEQLGSCANLNRLGKDGCEMEVAEVDVEEEEGEGEVGLLKDGKKDK
jgi:hypothetical protein